MPKKAYGWERGELPVLGAHSLAKHTILRRYVERYLEVLTARLGTEKFRLSLVDGFAGGGEYVDGKTGGVLPGSPLILLDAVRHAEAAINASRTKSVSVDARFYFVENNPAVAKFLLEVLRKRGDDPPRNKNVVMLEGDFDAKLPEIIAAIKSRGRAHRAVLLLDQYGYTDVPVASLASIFNELPNAEVFLTLAVGWITAYLRTARDAAQKLGIDPERLSQLSSKAEDIDVHDPNARPDLRVIQQLLHHAFTNDVGTRFYTPFFIVSRESNRPYWFLHMANSARANDVVKTLHWEIENHFMHFGKAGLGMLGYDPHEDPSVTGQSAFDFSRSAQRETLAALVRDVPRRIAHAHATGITFADLFQSACNETPATKQILAEAVRDLCIEGELEKSGGQGERRANGTLPHDDDIVRVARQTYMKF